MAEQRAEQQPDRAIDNGRDGEIEMNGVSLNSVRQIAAL